MKKLARKYLILPLMSLMLAQNAVAAPSRDKIWRAARDASTPEEAAVLYQEYASTFPDDARAQVARKRALDILKDSFFAACSAEPSPSSTDEVEALFQGCRNYAESEEDAEKKLWAQQRIRDFQSAVKDATREKNWQRCQNNYRQAQEESESFIDRAIESCEYAQNDAAPSQKKLIDHHLSSLRARLRYLEAQSAFESCATAHQTGSSEIRENCNEFINDYPDSEKVHLASQYIVEERKRMDEEGRVREFRDAQAYGITYLEVGGGALRTVDGYAPSLHVGLLKYGFEEEMELDLQRLASLEIAPKGPDGRVTLLVKALDLGWSLPLGDRQTIRFTALNLSGYIDFGPVDEEGYDTRYDVYGATPSISYEALIIPSVQVGASFGCTVGVPIAITNSVFVSDVVFPDDWFYPCHMAAHIGF